MKKGLTFSDVLIVPKKTPLASRRQANLETRFSKNITLKKPFVSANMATVTEDEMAIELAKTGCLGIIHQFQSVAKQAEQVRKVKRATSYVVENPLVISPDESLADAKKVMSEEGISSLIVLKNDTPVGILTKRDYLFVTDDSMLVSSLMSTDLVTAHKDIRLDDAKKIFMREKIEKLILLDNAALSGLITATDIQNLENWDDALRDDKGKLLVGAAVGVKDSLKRSKVLVEAGVDVIVLDIAHAHSDYFIDTVKVLKSEFDVDVVGGNIATKQAAKDLIDAGIDGLKVGIGPSPVCSTRLKSGAGVPQLTAILDVCSVANKAGVPVIADGGIKMSGDVVKAIAAGASCVMSGSLFAGTDEAPTPILEKDGRKYKRYMGSASYKNNENMQMQKIGKRVKQTLDVFVEGVSKLVDYKGPVRDVVDSLSKGVMSGVSYCGCKNLSDINKAVEFIEITSNSWAESLTR